MLLIYYHGRFSLGEKISKPTLLGFYEYAKEAFLVTPLELFSTRIQYPIKTYAIDTSFINYVNSTFSKIIVALMENVVAVQLQRIREFKPTYEIYYWNRMHCL